MHIMMMEGRTVHLHRSGMRIQDKGCSIWDTGHRIKNKEQRVHDTEYRIQNIKSELWQRLNSLVSG